MVRSARARRRFSWITRVFEVDEISLLIQYDQERNFLSLPPFRRDAGIRVGGFAVVVFLRA